MSEEYPRKSFLKSCMTKRWNNLEKGLDGLYKAKYSKYCGNTDKKGQSDSRKRSLRGYFTGFLLVCGLVMSLTMVIRHGSLAYDEPDIELLKDFVAPPKDRIEYRSISNATLKNVVRIVYNRVPKCGSSAVESVIRHLAILNNFTYYRSKLFRDPMVPEEEQVELGKRLATLPTPYIYDRHIHWVDLKKYMPEHPVYLNLVREPLEQRVSAFYYRRTMAYNQKKPKSWLNMTFDECVEKKSLECVGPYAVSLGYLCGQEKFCRQVGAEALATAKSHLEHEYSVVGITEDLDGFFFVLEKVLPDYFQGACNIYEPLKAALLSKYKTPNRGGISEKTRQVLADIIHDEVELYEFARQRFYELLASLLQYRPLGKEELNLGTVSTQW